MGIQNKVIFSYNARCGNASIWCRITDTCKAKLLLNPSVTYRCNVSIVGGNTLEFTPTMEDMVLTLSSGEIKNRHLTDTVATFIAHSLIEAKRHINHNLGEEFDLVIEF
ncbi:MAG TPA: hypothetical protein DD377_00475 [Firmicutes bacterium]|nr:hypothetical protein [Bacillota bacterium]